MVTAVSPAGGAEAAATAVMMTAASTASYPNSSKLLALYRCQFDNQLSVATLLNSTAVLCQAPVHSVAVVNVTVTLNGIPQDVSNVNTTYVYYNKPTASSFVPIGGPLEGNTSVTFVGSLFVAHLGNESVKCKIDLSPPVIAAATVLSPSYIVCRTPPSLVAFPAQVAISLNGIDFTYFLSKFSYYVQAKVSVVSPAGASVTSTSSSPIVITGAQFQKGLGNQSLATRGLQCKFGSVVVDATYEDVDRITCPPPRAGVTEGILNVEVAINGVDFSASSPVQQFLLYSDPTLTQLSVGGGPLTAGTIVTLQGSGFIEYAPLQPLYACQFGSTLVPATWKNTSQMSCSAPVSAAGAVSLQVSLNNMTRPIVSVRSWHRRYSRLPYSRRYWHPCTHARTTRACTHALRSRLQHMRHMLQDATQTSSTTNNVTGSKALKFLYYPAPQLVSVDPLGGPLAGGTVVTISGSNIAALLGHACTHPRTHSSMHPHIHDPTYPRQAGQTWSSAYSVAWL